MPLPLVHLSVAHSLLQSSSPAFDDISPSEFYLGAISPDAIHMRKGWTREAKRRIHVFSESKELHLRLQRIDILMKEMESTTEISFLYGWISHLVTDALWSHYVVHGFWDEHSKAMSDECRRESYYRENDKIEYLLFREVPWRPRVFAYLSSAEALSVRQYLTAVEISAWRDRFLRWHTEIGKEPEEEPMSFTMERIGVFLQLAELVCCSGFEQTFTDTIEIVISQYTQECIGKMRG